MGKISALSGDVHAEMKEARGELKKEEPDDECPQVNPIKLGSLYDPRTKNCRGYLHKKGGSTGRGNLIGRRNWNKRLFVIETNIDNTHNYTMKYYKENASAESGSVPMHGTKAVVDHKEHSANDVG